MRQERKVVSVVFCDLVGFTGRSEAMDPEDVRALLSPYHDRVRDELERFGGTVEKFIGDAVVAVFGAPTAHEDDPERAVRASLAICEWAAAQPDVEVRIAVNTGEALVSLDADPHRGEGMVAGDVINTASRIQSAAPINGVLVGAVTHRATASVIDYVDVEPIVAKGKSEPVVVFEARGARANAAHGVDRTSTTEFVGRDREFNLLREAFERARQEHEPQQVTIVGVPGAGKSRLVAELARVVDADSDLVTWRHGRCLAYGDAVSFWALTEIVKAETGILDSDTPEVAESKLNEVTRSLIQGSDADWVARRLRPLLGLASGEGGVSNEETFPAWRRFLEALAERGPFVLVVEDLHWADEGLLDFLAELGEWLRGLPVLLVGTARPELLTRRPTWGAGMANALVLSLAPLTAQDTARLVLDVLGVPVLDASVQQALVERAAGNPLFAEEFARMVSDRGVADDRIPDTVQGIIAARLDGLAVGDKQLLQAASVIGTVFWSGAVAALAGRPFPEVEQTLRELEKREFVRRERRSSVEGETEFAFRHALARDVAYGQIPRADRSRSHRQAAEWISALGRPDDHAELLAHHYAEALEFGRAAGADTAELEPAAIAAFRRAGDRAFGLGSYLQASRFFTTALELTPASDPQRSELLLSAGAAACEWDRTGQKLLVEALSRLREEGKPELAARAGLLLARETWFRGDAAGTRAWRNTVDEILVGLPDSDVRVEALVVRAVEQYVGDEHEVALVTIAEALPLVEQMNRPDLLSRLLDARGGSRVALGDEDGFAEQQRAYEIARDARAIHEMNHTRNNLIVSYMRTGNLKMATQLGEEWADYLREFGGSKYNRLWYRAGRAELAFLAGDWALTTAGLDELLLDDREGDYVDIETRRIHADMLSARGQTPEALSEVDRALAAARRAGDPQVIVPAMVVRTSVLFGAGRAPEAAAQFDELHTMSALPSVLASSAHISTYMWLAVDLGRTDQAAEVAALIDIPWWAGVARAILGSDAAGAAEMLGERGFRVAEMYCRLRAGGSHTQRALELFKEIGAVRYIAEAERLQAAHG
jgi:class 3 adenylate cyclase/tetratricopeptide (TPR) repeat protein